MPRSAMRTLLERVLLRTWKQRGLLAMLMLPIAAALQVLAEIRRTLYRCGIFQVHRVPAMVIVVGNVITGGAGKTPTVISLVQHLRAMGLRVGVVSRGYGRTSHAIQAVLPDASAQDTGDEPLLVQRTTQVPVWVGPSRYETAMALLAHNPDTDIIVCDDGLQHYGLYRDLEVCVFDNRGCGNGWTLPAGPLREIWPRAPLHRVGQTADRLLVLHTGDQPAFDGFTAQRSLANFLLRSDGTQLPLQDLQAQVTKPLMAVAGIAQPEVFFDMLRAKGLILAATSALPDHDDFESCSRDLGDTYQLVCTEKDAVKLWPRQADALAAPLVQIAHETFWKAIDAQVQSRLAARLSSSHGHKTT